MESVRFDRLTRAFCHLHSRRGLTHALGLSLFGLPGLAEAKRKRKHKKKKKVKRNTFGCVNFGNFCKNAGQCCSGLCEGKKGKKRCQAHDFSTCEAGQQEGFCGEVNVPCTTSGGAEFLCNTTTGNAAYCGSDGFCVTCAKDADCTALCGPQAACVVCAGCAEEPGGAVTLCVGPEPDSCSSPG